MCDKKVRPFSVTTHGFMPRYLRIVGVREVHYNAFYQTRNLKEEHVMMICVSLKETGENMRCDE